MMNNKEYEQLEDWQKAFYDLNMKIGNNAWGCALEGDGMGNLRIRVYVNNFEFKKVVMRETGGKIENYPLVFTVLNQKDYAVSELRRATTLSKNKNERQQKNAKSTTSKIT